MSGLVAPLLAPFEGESPAGTDPRNTDEFEAIGVELEKIGGVALEPVDWGLVADKAGFLLQSVGKDLRCAVYWGVAKVSLEGPAMVGVAIELLSTLLGTFGAEIHPRRPRGRASIIRWFAERLDIEIQPGGFSLSADEKQALIAGVEALASALRELEIDAEPAQRIQGFIAERCLLELTEDEQRQKVQARFDPEFADLAVTILGDAAVTGETPRGLRLRRWVYWDAVPQLDDGVMDTDLGDINPLLDLLERGSWQELLARAEEEFVAVPFWLDLTYFTWKAAAQVFDRYAADGVLGVFRDLLTRNPELVDAVDNAGTPLASDETRRWIRDSVWMAADADEAGSSDVQMPRELRALFEEGRLQDALVFSSSWVAHPDGRTRFARSVVVAEAFAAVDSVNNSHIVFRGLHNQLRQMTVKEWDPPIFAACIRGYLHTKRDSMGLGPEDEHLLDELSAMDPAMVLSILATGSA